MSTNHKNRRIAEETYWVIRAEAMSILEKELKEAISQDIQLTHITPEALNAAFAWRDNYFAVGRQFHEPAWDWNKEVKRFKRRPRRVELAIWSENQLCGLVLGRISDRCVVATIHLIESNPNHNPLKGMVAPIATRYLETLGVSINAHEVSIESPVNGLINFYKELGFEKEVKKGQKVIRLKKAIEKWQK